MNTMQVARQIKHLLVNRYWENDSVNNKLVFGNTGAYITPGPTQQAFSGFRFPMVLVNPLSATSDPQMKEEPGLIQQDFSLILLVSLFGDKIGENAMIGAHRGGNVGESAGRGLLEIEEEMDAAVARINDLEGLRIRMMRSGAVGSIRDEQMGGIAYRDYTYSAKCTISRYYHAPLQFAATDATGGDASLTWKIPASRFDTNSLVIRRAAGSTAPTDETGGTDVPVTVNAVALTDDPGVGQFSYAIFRGYDEDGDTTSERFSDQEAGTTATVTVT